MRWLKEHWTWIKNSLPVIENGRVHFTRNSIILIVAVVSALLTGFYVLGILAGMNF